MRCGSSLSNFFPVDTGVVQGRVEAPILFNNCMYHALAKMIDGSECHLAMCRSDLDFADDAAYIGCS